MDGHSHHVAQPAHRPGQVEDQGNGQPLPVHLHLRVAGKVFQPGRLQKAMSANTPEDLQRIYHARFEKTAAYRRKVWSVLLPDFFQQYVDPAGTVLDLGAGYGEFINQVQCGKKYAMDLNPGTKA